MNTPYFYKNIIFYVFFLIQGAFVSVDTTCYTMRSSWFEIQEQAHDAVVQIFSCGACVDIIRPYKTPEELYGCGSGFFINDQGFILTNAHVVNQAVTEWIQMPSLGKEKFDVTVIGISVERDIALLKLTDESLAAFKNQKETITFLELADSDSVEMTDEVLMLGYPLGQNTLKGVTGDICGMQHTMIQVSTPANYGNSGGPLLDKNGNVIGILTSGDCIKIGDSISFADGINYIVPSNAIKVVLNELFLGGVVPDPRFGIRFYAISESHIRQLGNPLPGGCYIVEVATNSLAERFGLQEEDMIYKINECSVDAHGMVTVPWSKDKISLSAYFFRLNLGSSIVLKVFRFGEELEFSGTYEIVDQYPVRHIALGHDSLQYIVFGGMVIMELTLNHIKELPTLRKYYHEKNQFESVLLVTHVFYGSDLGRMEVIYPGYILQKINNQLVKTVEEASRAFKEALSESLLSIEGVNTIGGYEEKTKCVLPIIDILKSERDLSHGYGYPLASFVASALK